MQEGSNSSQVVSLSPAPTEETRLLQWGPERGDQGKVIACVDRSGTDLRVVAHARAIARRLQAGLVLAQVLEPARHVVGPQDPVSWGIMRHKGRERLEWLQRQQSFDCAPEQILLEGRAADELSGWVADVNLPLLALATHGDERSAGPGLGSTAQRLLEIAPASLLLIPPTASETPTYQRIIVPLDGSCRAESVLPTVVMLARNSIADVLVVHVVPQPQFTQFEPLESEAVALRDQIIRRNEQVARIYLERVLHYLQSAGVEARSILLHGDARECVQRVAAEQAADLIVLAAHGQTGRADMACGSVASYLAAHAATPILIVRDDEEGRATKVGHSTQEYCSLQFIQ